MVRIFLVIFCNLLCRLLCHPKIISFISFFQIYMIFISLSCLIVWARTSSTMLNSSGKNRHPCLLLILEQIIQSFKIKYHFKCILFLFCYRYSLSRWESSLLQLVSWVFFSWIGVEFCQMFSLQLVWYFFFFSLLEWLIPLTDFWLLN